MPAPPPPPAPDPVADRDDRAHADAACDDAGLWGRALRGDEAAFTMLFRRHQRPLYRFALRLTGAPALAEDAVQDVFMGLVDRAAAGPRTTGGYDPARGGLRPYLFGAVRNAACKRLRAAGPVAAAAGELAAEVGPAAEETQALRRAIAALEPAFREVLLLCELEGLSYEETAAALEIPVGTVRSRLSRARARLGEALGADEAAARGAAPRKEAR